MYAAVKEISTLGSAFLTNSWVCGGASHVDFPHLRRLRRLRESGLFVGMTVPRRGQGLAFHGCCDLFADCQGKAVEHMVCAEGI